MCVGYTSGSTGVPKGVVVPHSAVRDLVAGVTEPGAPAPSATRPCGCSSCTTLVAPISPTPAGFRTSPTTGTSA
ncbi:hypothetical protein [Streptomyces sp. NBC_00203]|uniref:hypothetical protein n=1 Tax=Streptomyces sp. NBC_00203 TaxID=2975680 RepID=UPI00386536BF